MLFDTRVAIQEPTEVRSAAGGVSYAYSNVSGLDSVPARIVPVTQERRGEQMVVTTDHFSVLLGGSFPTLTDAMVVLSDQGVFDIKRVVPPPVRTPAVTQLITERVLI